MARRRSSDERPPRPSIREVGFTNWLNAMLFPYIGPPPVGPYDEAPLAPSTASACPLCGAPMSQHVVDRSGPRTMLHCPRLVTP
ncbi:hypothetical protein ELQ90_02915 [Labedella phragmitis]|uniref:Type IV secretion protein Rhs n=1 Tax=Labedella phragmitis TaxID=2498849 RepID=A0A3S4APA0_9MICO|nr:hypothetical protein ELQ90_02915 [Labedella phragmitis]